MGQLPTRDQRPQLPVQIMQTNVHPVINKQPLHICPALSIQKGEQIFFVQKEQELQAVYRFGTKYTVHIQLRKQSVKNIKGVFLKLAEEYVYAYKHRKLDRADKIKPQKLLFKKRIYANSITSGNKQMYNKITENSNKNEKETTQKKQQLLLLHFAQIKLMSLLQLGARLGRVHTQCDGILTPEYIEFYSQATIDKITQSIAKNSQLKQLQKRLLQKNLYHEGLLKNQNLSYSRWRKGYVLKQQKFHESISSRKNASQQSMDNQSIHYIIRMFQTQVTKVIMDLQNEAKMLPFMNNLIFQNDFEKAVSKIQQSITTMENESQKLENQKIMSKMKEQKQPSMSLTELKQQGSSSSINSLSTLKNNSIVKLNTSNSNIKDVRSKIMSRIKKSRKNQKQNKKDTDFIQSPQKDHKDNNNIQQIYQMNEIRQQRQSQPEQQQRKEQINGSPQKMLQYKEVQNEPGPQQKIQNHSNDPQQIHYQQKLQRQKHSNKLKEYKTKLTFAKKLKSLKTSILDKNNTKSYQILQQLTQLKCNKPIEVQIIFCKLLLENARSRHALTILERILYFLNEVPKSQIYFYYEIALLAGILHYHRYSYSKALKSFQKALSILIKLSHNSIKMICIYNNIACIYYVMKNFDKCMFYLHRGFKIGEYSVDYQYLMRSNTAMALAQMGKVKEAKAQMIKINKIVQPVNNMVVFCKFYSNLAYLQLIDSGDSKSLQKAMNNFQQACNIEQKYLIPNEYRPSIFLHNNIAMLHYKRKQFKKAKFHSQKILNQLNDVEGLVAIRVHFNIGKIFSQGYNYDLPLKHFHQARILLNKIDQNKQPSIKLYRQRICKEIEELERMRIDQVSEQESHKFSYMSSSLLKKV